MAGACQPTAENRDEHDCARTAHQRVGSREQAGAPSGRPRRRRADAELAELIRKRRADQGSAREVRARVGVREDVVGERLVVVDEPRADHADAVDEVTGREVGKMATVSRRMARTDPQRRAVGELQLDDAVTPGDGLPVHQLDRDDGKRSAIDAVDEIADFQISNRSIADGRRDRRRRRGAVAVRAAGGARPVDRLVAPRHRRAERHRAADLRAGAATSSAAGHPEVARRPRRRVARRAATRAVGAVGAGPRAGVAAASAIEDVVAGVDAESTAALESLAVGVALTGLATAGAARASARPATAGRSAARSTSPRRSGRSAPACRSGRSHAARTAASGRSTAGAATRRRTEVRRDVHAARTFRRPATDLLDGAHLAAAGSGCSGRAGAAATSARTARSARAATSAVRSAGSATPARPALPPVPPLA